MDLERAKRMNNLGVITPGEWMPKPIDPYVNLMKQLTPKEAIRIAYIPIVVGNACIMYATQIADLSARIRLPYKKECRSIREHCNLYVKEAIGAVSHEVLKKLDDQTASFFSEAGDSVQTLYWVLRQELSKKYPELDDYNLLTLIYVYKSLFYYILDFQNKSDRLVRERTGTSFFSKSDPNLKPIMDALEVIGSKYTIENTSMINMAMKVISNRIDGLIFSDIEITND